ncbi:hypothetical protein H0I23_08705 [Cellulophaga sp. HaHaR_3_176]|uniref:hypothetical protein n=1 Tax=Cellulophaga sp. HaHaR_3_176 TaxID=1942464 RepID=UPI001C1F2E64|nr:hypothetical protein [Cellulophaga sp. HaHaR_3_176]QWX82556.1 hypothetical protein H0I23_08705 [Cellulophaga sp. HaHaR_3_176]
MKLNNYNEFDVSLKNDMPDPDWSEGLKALWFDAKGDWNASHDIAQDLQTPLGSLIHAYLHRKEGDKFNAEYWYRKAGTSYPKISLKEELKKMVVSII